MRISDWSSDVCSSDLVEEHDQACESLRHLRDLDMESPQWMATFAAVAAALERHLEAEETRLLPLCQALLSEERAAMLGLRYDEDKIGRASGRERGCQEV